MRRLMNLLSRYDIQSMIYRMGVLCYFTLSEKKVIGWSRSCLDRLIGYDGMDKTDKTEKIIINI